MLPLFTLQDKVSFIKIYLYLARGRFIVILNEIINRFLIYLFGHAPWQVGSYFPHQGSNPSRNHTPLTSTPPHHSGSMEPSSRDSQADHTKPFPKLSRLNQLASPSTPTPRSQSLPIIHYDWALREFAHSNLVFQHPWGVNIINLISLMSRLGPRE